MDQVFLLTLLFIFLSALIGTFVKRRSRDLCLKDFTGFHVTAVMKNGSTVWGRLLAFPNGIELLYASPHRDRKGHLETSSLFFGDQMPNIQAVYRFRDELTEKQRIRRRCEIRRTYHPNFIRRLRRRLRNFVNTFRDAFNQSIGVAVAQMKKTSAASPVVQTQDARLTQMGQTILGGVPSAYEPMLERYIGRRVVAEELRDGTWIEHPGILKEYTAAWIEILDCLFVREHSFDLNEPGQLQVNRDLDFVVGLARRDAGTPVLRVRIENRGRHAVRILRLEGEDAARAFNVEVQPGRDAEIVVDDLPASLFESSGNGGDGSGEIQLRAGDEAAVAAAPQLPRVRLVIEARREGDLCLPRTHAVVRHGGEILESWSRRLRAWGSFAAAFETARSAAPGDPDAVDHH